MQRWLSLFLVYAFVVGMGLSNAQAESLRVAYVDVPRAIAGSQAAKNARDILQQKLAVKQKEVDAMEMEIKGLKSNLEKRQSVMSSEKREEMAGEIRNKFREYQRLVEDNQAAIDRENGRWTKKITEVLKEVVTEMGNSGKYVLIFGKGQVLYHAPSTDITEEVLRKLNQRTKSWF